MPTSTSDLTCSSDHLPDQRTGETRAPRASVVIATYRGERRVPAVLEALARQTVPTSDFEVIVVDDGSPQGAQLGAVPDFVTVVALRENAGPGHARNVGAARATAPVLVFLDDDCLPEPTWLAELLAGFDDADVLGVAGLPVPRSEHDSGLAMRFQEAKNPWRPGSTRETQPTTRIGRLGRYLRAQLDDQGPESGEALFAASAGNLAFRRTPFLDAGGFRDGLRTGEDIEVCLRLRATYPEQHIAYRPEAQATHRIDGRLGTLVRRYHVWGMGLPGLAEAISAPPVVYPFPVAMLAAAALSRGRPGRLLAVAALPLLTYPRWTRQAWAERHPRPLTYAYLQLLIEGASNVGLAEALVAARFERHDRASRATLTRYGG